MPTTGTSAPERLFSGWHTSIHDGYRHAVTDAGFTEGARRWGGQFETVCGQIICVAALVPPYRPHGPRLSRHTPPATRESALGRHAYGACA